MPTTPMQKSSVRSEATLTTLYLKKCLLQTAIAIGTLADTLLRAEIRQLEEQLQDAREQAAARALRERT